MRDEDDTNKLIGILGFIFASYASLAFIVLLCVKKRRKLPSQQNSKQSTSAHVQVENGTVSPVTLATSSQIAVSETESRSNEATEDAEEEARALEPQRSSPPSDHPREHRGSDTSDRHSSPGTERGPLPRPPDSRSAGVLRPPSSSSSYGYSRVQQVPRAAARVDAPPELPDRNYDPSNDADVYQAVFPDQIDVPLDLPEPQPDEPHPYSRVTVRGPLQRRGPSLVAPPLATRSSAGEDELYTDVREDITGDVRASLIENYSEINAVDGDSLTYFQIDRDADRSCGVERTDSLSHVVPVYSQPRRPHSSVEPNSQARPAESQSGYRHTMGHTVSTGASNLVAGVTNLSAGADNYDDEPDYETVEQAERDLKSQTQTGDDDYEPADPGYSRVKRYKSPAASKEQDYEASDPGYSGVKRTESSAQEFNRTPNSADAAGATPYRADGDQVADGDEEDVYESPYFAYDDSADTAVDRNENNDGAASRYGNVNSSVERDTRCSKRSSSGDGPKS